MSDVPPYAYWTFVKVLDKVRNPYPGGQAMLAKITAKNQLTLPKSLTQAVGATDYFDVEVRGGQLILTPVRIQRGDAVRAKLAELNLTSDDVSSAVMWARELHSAPALAAEPTAPYALKGAKPLITAAKKARPKA
jgi:antitoxin component of MazEF toxin-antitoxin module